MEHQNLPALRDSFFDSDLFILNLDSDKQEYLKTRRYLGDDPNELESESIITNSENIRESDCDEKIQVGEIVMDERLRMIYQHNKRWYGHYHSNRQHYDHVIKQPNRRVPLESILSF